MPFGSRGKEGCEVKDGCEVLRAQEGETFPLGARLGRREGFCDRRLAARSRGRGASGAAGDASVAAASGAGGGAAASVGAVGVVDGRVGFTAGAPGA